MYYFKVRLSSEISGLSTKADRLGGRELRLLVLMSIKIVKMTQKIVQMKFCPFFALFTLRRFTSCCVLAVCRLTLGRLTLCRLILQHLTLGRLTLRRGITISVFQTVIHHLSSFIFLTEKLRNLPNLLNNNKIVNIFDIFVNFKGSKKAISKSSKVFF